ncbi:hypothetical protein Mgra_00003148 [Meloidogyne graminicola]|uniref:Transmembrane protein n=1 Tax=Meloidogyne graminicola TaxID=189291 RepID=A0A8S9ZW87_9BILA|nr:hypothetical protein Mgra_00003148 [Meloidogyne graminicola]
MGFVIIILFLLFIPTYIVNEMEINTTTTTTESSSITTTLDEAPEKDSKENRIIDLKNSQHDCIELLKHELHLVENISEGEKECREIEIECRKELEEARANYNSWKTWGIIFIVLTIISCCCYYCCCYLCAYLNSHEEHRAKCFS